jgi:hypothetical protein
MNRVLYVLPRGLEPRNPGYKAGALPVKLWQRCFGADRRSRTPCSQVGNLLIEPSTTKLCPHKGGTFQRHLCYLCV